MKIDISDTTKKIIDDIYKQKRFIENPTCYFYDLDIIEENINTLMSCMPKEVHLYYAMKANNHELIMDKITKNSHVAGIEIASLGELNMALQYEKAQNIIFTGPGKTEFELEAAVRNGIRLLNIESVVEAIRIDNIAKKLDVEKVDVLIRINLNYSISGAGEQMAGCSTKMGIDQDDYIEAFNLINKLERINIRGIHVFAASGVLDYKQLIKSNRFIFDFVKEVEGKTKKIEIIDFGGGLGIDYSNEAKVFEIEKYSKELKKLISEYSFENKEFIIELGTYIVGNAGYYTSQIIDIKSIKGKKHIIIAGGVNHMGLPLEMRRKQPVYILKQNVAKLYEGQVSVNNELADISGPLCMVTDKLSWDEYINEANIGDIVVYLQAGAYCYGEGMLKFLSHPEPGQIIISKGVIIDER